MQLADIVCRKYIVVGGPAYWWPVALQWRSAMIILNAATTLVVHNQLWDLQVELSADG